jgi:hypothetical protein
MRVYEPLDRVLLGEFARRGALSREDLVRTGSGGEFDLTSETVADWMESARLRALICRRDEMTDTADRQLSAAEWDLTSDGRQRYATHRWQSGLDGIWQVTKSLVPLVGLALALAKAFGAETLPAWGLSLLVGLLLLILLSIVGALLGSSRTVTRAATRHAVRYLNDRGKATCSRSTDGGGTP